MNTGRRHLELFLSKQCGGSGETGGVVEHLYICTDLKSCDVMS